MENFNPTFWNDSPTAVEQIRFLIKQNLENENKIKSVEDTLQDILKWIENTDSKIKEEVTKVVWQMYENGELQQIIKDVTNEYIVEQMANAPKCQSIDFKRKTSHLTQTYDYSYGDSAGNFNSQHYQVLQGACHFKRNGLSYFAYYQINNNSKTDYYYSNVGNLSIYDENGVKQFEGLLEAGHGNDITYHPVRDELLICWSSRYVNKVSEKSFNISGVSLKNGFNGITKKGNLIQANVYTIDRVINGLQYAEFDNNLYAFNQYQVYQIDDLDKGKVHGIHDLYEQINNPNSTVNGQLLNTLNSDNNYNTNQTAAISENYVYYLRFNPNVIIRYNRKLNIFDTAFQIPNCLDDGKFNVGEPESIDVEEDGTCYLHCYSYLGHRQITCHTIVQSFVTNIVNPAMAPNVNLTSGANLVADPYSRAIYVDSRQNISNPSGSELSPFRSVDEACWFANNARWCTNRQIYVNVVYEEVHTPIWIGSNAGSVILRTAPTESEKNIRNSIGNVFGEGNACIVITDLQVLNRIPKNAEIQAFEHALIGVRNGARLLLTGSVKLTNVNSNDNKALLKYAIYCQYSFLIMNQGGDLPTKDSWKEGTSSVERQMLYATGSAAFTQGHYPSTSLDVIN